MFRIKVMMLLAFACFLASCQRTSYEMFRQMSYQECLKQSRRPAEDCQSSPDFDEYQRLRKERYAE